MPTFTSQHTAAVIEGAISAITGDTSAPNGTTVVTSVGGAEYIGLWDSGTPKTITYANFVSDVALESGLLEGVDDRVAALLNAGQNVTLTYNDVAGTLTVAVTTIDNAVVGGVTPAAGTFTNFTASGTTTLNAVAYTWPASDGTNGYVLSTNGSGTLSWTALSAGFSGPVSSTDNAIARFDGVAGDTVQNSGVTIDDSNNIAGVAGLTATSLTVSGSTTLNTVPYTWPAADGTSGYVLSTDGAGTLSWIAAGGGGGSDYQALIYAITF